MSSRLAPILTNIFMEWFEEKALQTSKANLKNWIKYIPTLFYNLNIEKKNKKFIKHISNIHPNI